MGVRVAAEVAEHVDEVLPVELRMIDLEHIALDRDLQRLAVDRVHFHPGARLIVGDDVDLAGDEAYLDGPHFVHVDCLGTVYEPLLPGHAVLLYHSTSSYIAFVELKLYRVPRTRNPFH